MVEQISWSGGTTRFTYGPDRQRFKRVDSESGKTTTTLYIGDTEKIYYSDSTVEWKRNIGGVALVTHRLDASETQEASRTLRYLLKDHLGSINLITDIYGMPEEQLAFDPWGKRRDETVWAAQADLTTWLKSRKPITSRGFTGHEMIDGADVIHMNGRIYDSHIARFLQSDPLIQDPTVSGSLNRYSYVWNNPLNTTDPSGYAGFKQDQEEQKRAQTRACSASSCSYRDADGNWVSGGFGSTMDLGGGSQAATQSANEGGTLEHGASADASVTQEVNAGQKSNSNTKQQETQSGATPESGRPGAKASEEGATTIDLSGPSVSPPDSSGHGSNIGRCASEGKCHPQDFSDKEKAGIQSRIDDLTSDLRIAPYGSMKNALEVLHESGVQALADEYGLEFWAQIDGETNEIYRVSTGFDKGLSYGADNLRNSGDIIWHTHPSGRDVWAGDLQSAVSHGASWIFASGRRMTGIQNPNFKNPNSPSQYRFDQMGGMKTKALMYDGGWHNGTTTISPY